MKLFFWGFSDVESNVAKVRTAAEEGDEAVKVTEVGFGRKGLSKNRVLLSSSGKARAETNRAIADMEKRRTELEVE